MVMWGPKDPCHLTLPRFFVWGGGVVLEGWRWWSPSLSPFYVFCLFFNFFFWCRLVSGWSPPNTQRKQKNSFLRFLWGVFLTSPQRKIKRKKKKKQRQHPKRRGLGRQSPSPPSNTRKDVKQKSFFKNPSLLYIYIYSWAFLLEHFLLFSLALPFE